MLRKKRKQGRIRLFLATLMSDLRADAVWYPSSALPSSIYICRASRLEYPEYTRKANCFIEWTHSYKARKKEVLFSSIVCTLSRYMETMYVHACTLSTRHILLIITAKEGLNNTNPMVIKRGDPFVQVLEDSRHYPGCSSIHRILRSSAE